MRGKYKREKCRACATEGKVSLRRREGEAMETSTSDTAAVACCQTVPESLLFLHGICLILVLGGMHGPLQGGLARVLYECGEAYLRTVMCTFENSKKKNMRKRFSDDFSRWECITSHFNEGSWLAAVEYKLGCFHCHRNTRTLPGLIRRAKLTSFYSNSPEYIAQ